MLPNVKILILEDILTDAEFAVNHIKLIFPKLEYLVVDNEQDFINALNNYKPDIIISDYSLPNYDGLSALKTAKEISPLIPFIIVTGSLNEESAFDYIKSGASDYVIQNQINRLGSSVFSALTKKELIIKAYQSENEIKKLNRIYSLLNNTNKIIVKVKDEQKLFDEFCRIAVEFGKFKMAWVGIVNNETQQVEVNTSLGDENNYLQNININLSDEKLKQGPTGQSILKNFHSIINDIDSNEYMIPWKDKALKSGFKSLASFPIKKFDSIIGAFNIYSDEINFFQEEEISLIDEMALDISFALENIEIQKQHKESNDKLTENEERLRLSLSAANQGMFDLNIKTGEAVVNDIYATMLGYDPKTFKETKSYWIERLHPEDKERVVRVNKDYIEGKISEYKVEYRQKTFNGNWKWVLSIGKIISYDLDGSPLRMLGTHTDITDQKLMEEKLKTSDRIFKHSPDLISISNNKNFIVLNPAWGKTLGWSIEELLSNPLTNFVHPDDVDSTKNAIVKTSMDGDKVYNFENRYICKDGSIKWLSWNAVPFLKENIIFGFARDITERKIMIMDLTESKEKAEEMNKIKSSFFANMSHELRTPLIGILGFSELLKEEFKDNPDTFDMINYINKSGNRLLETLNLILNISKLETSKTKFILQEINIIPLISESIKLYKGIALNKGIQLNFLEDKDVIKCPVDEGLFHHILNNVISNSIKFTQEGSVTITNKIVGNNVLINIKDTGIGIPEEKTNLIWEEFRQASEGFTRSFEGTGLGLTIAKKYTELMNGTITVVSKVNEGSTFTIKFPLAASQINTEPKIKSKTRNDINIKTENKINILYVEDDFIAAKLVKRILGDIYNLDFAESGDEAIIKFNNKIYDGFLMDINLKKGMDGVMVTKLIREKPEYKNTPIIAITAYAMDKDKEDFLSKGMTHYISKPYTIKYLKNFINDIFINN